MLNIINDIGIFLEDCQREISVREYARKRKISPPTASSLLNYYTKEEILIKRKERGFIFFRINKENFMSQSISRMYWQCKLKNLIKFLEKKYYSHGLILFGSISKLENTKESDLDICILTDLKKDVNVEIFEKKMGKKIQLFKYQGINKIPNNLRINIINGHILSGGFNGL